MLENCDKIMHLRFNFDACALTLRVCALDASESEQACIILSQFVKLGCLDLDHNSIVEIHMGTFNGLVKLGCLDLDHNSIVEIHMGTFNGLVKLGCLLFV